MMFELELSEEAQKRLRELAEMRQQAAEKVLTDLVEEYLAAMAPAQEANSQEDDPWLGFVALGRSGHSDTSTRLRDVMDELTGPARDWSLKDAD